MKLFLLALLSTIAITVSAQRKLNQDWDGKFLLSGVYQSSKMSGAINIEADVETILNGSYVGVGDKGLGKSIYGYGFKATYYGALGKQWLGNAGLSFARNFRSSYLSGGIGITHFSKAEDFLIFNKRIAFKSSRNLTDTTFEGKVDFANIWNFGITIAADNIISDQDLKVRPFIAYDVYRIREPNDPFKTTRVYRLFDRSALKTGFNFLYAEKWSLSLYTTRFTTFYYTSGNAGCENVNNPDCKLNIVKPYFGFDLRIYILKGPESVTRDNFFALIE